MSAGYENPIGGGFHRGHRPSSSNTPSSFEIAAASNKTRKDQQQREQHRVVAWQRMVERLRARYQPSENS